MNKIRLTVPVLCMVLGLTAMESSGDPIPGDLNNDNWVGIEDLNIVLGEWNNTVPPGDPRADVAGGDNPLLPFGGPDGFVGIVDLNVVLTDWNTFMPPVGDVSAAVPEPGTLVVFTIGAMSLMRRARRQGSAV